MGNKLTPYQDQDVIASSIAIPNVSGGLNQALAVDNLELPIGSTGVLAVEYVVKGHQHKRVKDTQALELVNVLTVTNGTLISPEIVAEDLENQRLRAEEARGVHQLPYNEDGDDATDDDEIPEDIDGPPADTE